MRYVEDKGCYNHGPTQDTPNSRSMYSEFHKGKDATRVSHHHRTTMGKPTPSKWDDAQKWLVGLSKGGEKSQSKSKPRNSNADDLRLIAPVPQKDHDYSSSEKEEEEHDGCHDFIITTTTSSTQYEAETKKVECDESIWRSNNKPPENTIPIQSICFRDMGTEMTPIASKEPSRTATPIRATTPATRSPIHSGTSTPMRGQNGFEAAEPHHGSLSTKGNCTTRQYVEGSSPCKMPQKKIEEQATKLSPLESRAMAWEEAERAKYMARFKREEVKIQAWENHQIRKAEMEMKKMEVKAERMKALAQERLANKLAATKRIAEDKKANAQVKLNDKALRTTERVEYIRRTGHVPSLFSFNFKLPSICW
ncbi:uncharacterized protein At3g61260 [Gastrolobium bilobum]|uniref:uncharacterized protein At3g61260 n=1 Tax=Gastrolobium bilobum TaxID=150636 RepID=UPI002AB0B6F9|nr:uncharacterized protein At3g61260 [Gastrolobium bilobum]